jgi:hypothetical protein
MLFLNTDLYDFLCDLIIALEERNIYSQFESRFYSSSGAIFFSKLRCRPDGAF